MLKIFDYLRKFFPSRKPPPPVTAAATWREILKEMPPKTAQTQKVIKPNPMNAIYPMDRLLVWENTVVPRNGRQKKPLGVFFELRTTYTGKYKVYEIFVQSVRKRDEPVTAALNELNSLFVAKTRHSSLKLQLKFLPEEHTETTTIDDFIADADSFQKLYISSEWEKREIRIVRLPGNVYPIQEVRLHQLPLTGLLMLPQVHLNDPNVQIQVRWLVRDKDAARHARTNFVELEEIINKRLLRVVAEPMDVTLPGFSVASEDLFFWPSDEHKGRDVMLVAGCGPDFPLYIDYGKVDTSEGPGELVSDCQIEWCKENRIPEDGDELRVMTFNILSQNCCGVKEEMGHQESAWFTYCRAEYLQLMYRSGVLFKLLHDFSRADVHILFLQEVDIPMYEMFLKRLFTALDFHIAYGPKPMVKDGVATVWKKDRFELISHKTYVLRELTKEYEDLREIIGDDEHTMSRYYDRKQVGNVSLLKDKNTGEYVVCANTHLHQDCRDQWIKLIQGVSLWRKAVEVQLENDRTSGATRKTHLILAGDLNSTPHNAFCQFLRNGFIEADNDVWSPEWTIPMQKIRLNPRRLEMRPMIQASNPAMEFTNYTADTTSGSGFHGVLDYVWVSSDGLRAVRHCPMPSEDVVKTYEGLPSKASPSDHIPVVVDLKYT